MSAPDPRLAALRALAEKATPNDEWYDADELRASLSCVYPASGVTINDPEFIAAASPGMVLSLLDALAAAEGDLAEAARYRRSSDKELADAREFAGRMQAERDALAARLAGAWTACADRMPSEEGSVLGWSDKWQGPAVVYRMTNSRHVWLDDESTAPLPTENWPTHWQPLPPSPSEAGGEGRGT